MTRLLRIRRLSVASAALGASLLATGCGLGVEEAEQPGGPAGGGLEAAQALAPEPAGGQHSHEEMRTALEETIEGADLTDTDDWWESLRDLNRELQKLRVSPTDCKPFVTASALPVPSGALTAAADHAPRQTAIYSFENADAAQSYVNQELEGAEECDEHTVTRALEDGDVTADTALEEVEIRSGAEDALAVSSAMESAEETQWGLAVMLRHDSTVVGTSQVLEAAVGQDEAEEVVVELEAEAAAVLSAITGEEILVPEPEPEDEPDDEEDQDSAEADEEAEPQDDDESDADTDDDGADEG